MGVILGVVVLVLALAFVARVRLWYYTRRWSQQAGVEMAAEAQAHALRDRCGRIWWEGQC